MAVAIIVYRCVDNRLELYTSLCHECWSLFPWWQLYCCGVDDNGWELYRKSRWFQQYGAMDEVRGLRYGHGTVAPPVYCRQLIM